MPAVSERHGRDLNLSEQDTETAEGGDINGWWLGSAIASYRTAEKILDTAVS